MSVHDESDLISTVAEGTWLQLMCCALSSCMKVVVPNLLEMKFRGSEVHQGPSELSDSTTELGLKGEWAKD